MYFATIVLNRHSRSSPHRVLIDRSPRVETELSIRNFLYFQVIIFCLFRVVISEPGKPIEQISTLARVLTQPTVATAHQPILSQSTPVIHNTVISSPQPTIIATNPSKPPQSLKAHVLSSQAAKAAISQLQSFQSPLNQSQPIQRPMNLETPQQQNHKSPIPSPQPQFLIKSQTPVNQNLNINVVLPNNTNAINLNMSPRQNVLQNIQQKVPVMSPVGIQNPKQHLLQAVKQPLVVPKMAATTAINPKVGAYFLNQQVLVPTVAPIQLVKPQQTQLNMVVQQPNHQKVVVSGGGINSGKQQQQLLIGQSPPISSMSGKPPHGLQHSQQQHVMTGAVASPPLKQHMMTQQPIVTGMFHLIIY